MTFEINNSIRCIRHAMKFKETIQGDKFVENDDFKWSFSEYIEMNLLTIEQELNNQIT